jgi:TonB family protein
MAPQTKEEVASAVSTQQPATQAASTQPKTVSSASRSDAVSLEVPVKIHGSSVKTQGATGTQTEPFSEQTTTIIVFPQGAVVRMTTAVHVGQMLVMANLKSRQDAICRVLKVRTFPNLQSYVEVEFTQPQPKYWGVYFACAAPAGTQGLAGPQAIKAKATPEIGRPGSPAQEVCAQKPAETASPQEAISGKPAPIAVSPKSKSAPAFASVESAARIQGATSVPQTLPRITTNEEQSSAAKVQNSEVAVQVPAPEPKVSPRDAKPEVEPLAASIEMDSNASSELLSSSAVSPGRGLGALRVVNPPAENPMASAGFAREPFAGEIGREFSGGRRQDWKLIGASAAVLVIAVLGGVWYFHSRTPASVVGTPSVVESAQQQPPSTSAQMQTPSPAVLPPVSTPGRAPAPVVANSDAISDTKPVSHSPHDAAPKENGSAKSETQSAAASELGVESASGNVFNPTMMKAHPLVSLRKTDSRDQAPALDPGAASGSEPGELPGMVSTPSIPRPAGPVTVGGRVKEPKLISSARPVYPLVAKQAHVEGDVVIDTLLDKDGNVAHFKVVSGPGALREAAVDALRRWKFEPTLLDGQPVEIEMFVTIKFRL